MPQRVAVDEVAVILLEKVLAELPVLVPAHAVVEAVDGLAGSGQVKEHLAGSIHPGNDVGVNLDLAAVVDHIVQILQS